MSYRKIWHEQLYNHCGQYFTVNKILYQDTTSYQNLIIFENTELGRIMALDGIVQTTEKDEFIYHEMITHVPLIIHGKAKRVLIIGGGDGGVLREVSRYSSVEQITMVEIDNSVVDLCRKYLPNHSLGTFNDPRFRLIIDNGLNFVSQSSEKFDVIISDCTDPVGPGADLFTADFYRGCALCLDQDGIFVSQNGVCFLQHNQVIDSYLNLRNYFNCVNFYQAAIPTYYGGIMIFVCATQNPVICYLDDSSLTKRINRTSLMYRYYNALVHKNSFTMPQYLLNALSAHY